MPKHMLPRSGKIWPARGLLAETAGWLVPTLEGLAVADSLARAFDFGDVDPLARCSVQRAHARDD